MKHILVVDDDYMLSTMINDMLEWQGYDVTVLRDAKDTIEQLKKKQFDLVLLDKLISGIDGTEVSGWIRSEEDLNNIPILMMTAMHEAKEECLEAGATDFISKPFEMDEFVGKIELLLERGGHK